jgi:uncharacterized membrane protein
MKSSQKSNWLVPTGLIMLSVIPMLAGSVRLLQIGSGAVITPENARFMTAPLPVVLHILSSVIYCVLGAFQFSVSFRRQNPNWHRTSGRLLVPLGLTSALSGLWMTQFYPHPAIDGPLIPANFDGQYLYAIRLLVGLAMAAFICLGFAAIRRRDIPSHRAWMMRGYALGIGAGTQAFTHIPWFLLPSLHGELVRTICMAAGWGINIAVAEWVISRNMR